MNTEAISEIKKAAQLSATVKEAVTGKFTVGNTSFATLNQIAAQIASESTNTTIELSTSRTGNHIYSNSPDYSLSETPISCFKIKTSINSYTAECYFSLNSNGQPENTSLIEATKSAVIEACESLCPGLPVNDIIAILAMCADQYTYRPDLALHLKKNDNRLKAGEIIRIDAFFESPAAIAHHGETVLVTANGCEILTRS